jgi:hypothetical protein
MARACAVRARAIARPDPKRRLRRDRHRPRSRAEQRDGERIKDGALRSAQRFRWNVVESQRARPFRQLLERIRRHGRLRPCGCGLLCAADANLAGTLGLTKI